jgi:hypothetical protein
MQTLESMLEKTLESKRIAFQEYVDGQKVKGTFNATEFAESNDFNFKDLSLRHKFAVAAKYTVLPAIAGAIVGITCGTGLGIIVSMSSVSGIRFGFRNNAQRRSELTIDSNGRLFKTPEEHKLFGKITLPF